MLSIVSYPLVILAIFSAVPVTVLLFEVLAAFGLPERQRLLNLSHAIRQRVVVLVPAHNESSGILLTLEDIKPQLITGDRLLVIADNCFDDTAAVATAAGVEVVERNEPSHHGKGYALDFGLKQISQNPPAIVIVIDADCRVKEGTIDQLAICCAMTNRPVQALDLMTAPDNSLITYRVAEFAWRVKNWVRPLGLAALKLPCQLMGTGMAFPWGVVCSVNFANRSIVEDLNLGLELALTGSPALFFPSAKVTSYFPLSDEAGKGQRIRWESGHIHLIFAKSLRLFYQAIVNRNLGLFILTLDLAVPPLSLLSILLAATFSIATIAAFFGVSPVAMILSAISFVEFILSVFISWLNCGRDILPPRTLVSVFSYVFAKLPLYSQLFFGRTVQKWTKTDRKNGA